ncbi:MAG TPA: hypothetical protein VI979_02305, partial [archaeon]|nr:hypothetical protein [archaeon]
MKAVRSRLPYQKTLSYHICRKLVNSPLSFLSQMLRLEAFDYIFKNSVTTAEISVFRELVE